MASRGQAFSTFKLMIAAVVAVAILGILLSILGGITMPGANPADMIGRQVSKASQYEGSTFRSSSTASFKSGTSYNEDSFMDKIGGVGTIKFKCASTLQQNNMCNGDNSGETNALRLNGAFSAKVGAQCEAGGGQPMCWVLIGNATSG